MKFEILKQSHLKRNILIGVVAALIISAVVFNFTRAKYRVTESIPLINGTITYDLADLNAVAVYVQEGDDYSKSDTIPKNGYLFNEERSYCSVNGEADESVTLSYDIRTKTLNIAPLTTKGTKCYLYFKTPTSISEILETKIFETRTNFRTTVTEDTTGTIYYADTSKGKTYYFAGNPSDNWVSFAGYYWRIIRINENGSIRLIYSGNSESEPAITGAETSIGISAFNTNYNDNAYVGYMYGMPGSTTYQETHANANNSSIKDILDEWYQNNLLEFSDKIDENAGFCGDRTPSTNSDDINNQGGVGKIQTSYGAWVRYIGQNNGVPTYDCSNEDLYTTSKSSNGNRALTYSIGLISMDEV